MSIDSERYVTDLEEQVDRLIHQRSEGRLERWRLLAMGWKRRCYTAGDALTDIAILHMQRPCSHGSEPHEPKRASNGEVWCSGPHCRTCGVVAPCGTYLLATKSGEADRP